MSYSPFAPTNGPLDGAERMVSMVWHTLWLFVAAVTCAGALRLVFIGMLAQALGVAVGMIVGGLLGLLIMASVSSWLLMRLRRLYLSTPGFSDPELVLARRRRFAIGANIGIGLMVCWAIVLLVIDLTAGKPPSLPGGFPGWPPGSALGGGGLPSSGSGLGTGPSDGGGLGVDPTSVPLPCGHPNLGPSADIDGIYRCTKSERFRWTGSEWRPIGE